MRSRRSFVLGFTGVVIAIVLPACNPTRQQLIGLWEEQGGKDIDAVLGQPKRIEFSGDGTVTFYLLNTPVMQGKWELKDSKTLVVTGDVTLTLTIEIQGDRMTSTGGNGKPEYFKRVKQ